MHLAGALDQTFPKSDSCSWGVDVQICPCVAAASQETIKKHEYSLAGILTNQRA
jgi:hypothetical protein